jgi:hypothetical protein
MFRKIGNDLQKKYLCKKKEGKKIFWFHQLDFENVNIITISISSEKNLNFVTLNLKNFKLQIKINEPRNKKFRTQSTLE